LNLFYTIVKGGNYEKVGNIDGIGYFSIVDIDRSGGFRDRRDIYRYHQTRNDCRRPQPVGKCCIAGKYNGFHKRIPTKTCPKPDEGKFIMEIFQDKGCGSKIWGTVTDMKDGTKQNFEGSVTPRGACCYIQGVMKRVGAAAPAPVEETKFWGTLCKKGTKWSGNGEYADSKGCKGTWSMTQM
jgi:hypothetical protein